MAAEFPLHLVIKAVDEATAPLRAINAKLKAFTAPIRKLNNSFRALSDEAGLPRLVKGFKGVGSAVSKVGSEAMSLGLQIAGMATAAGFGFYAIVKGSMEAGDKLGMMAERVGLGVDAYAQLQFAAAQADVEQEAFNSAMDQFNKRLGMAKAGGGELLAFLEKVAPALATQVKGAKNTEEALALMTGAFEQVTDPGKRAALAAAAFGKSGLQMGVFLGLGSKAIQAYRNRFYELAGSQEKFAQTSDELDQAVRETEQTFKGAGATIAGELFPALTDLAKALTNVLAGNRGQLREWAKETGAAISAWVKRGGVTEVKDALVEFGKTIGKVVDMLGGLKGVLMLVGGYMAIGFVTSVGTLIASLWSLGAAVVGTTATMGGALLAWAAGWATYLAAMKVYVLTAIVGHLGAMASAIWGVATAVGGFLVTIAPFVIAGAALAAAGWAIYKNWVPLKELFSDINMLWGAMKDTFGNPLESLKYAGKWWGKELGMGGSGPTLGAAAAAPPAPGAAGGGEARVVVDFNNAPKGTRVTPAPGGTVPLDLSLGFSMIGSP
jgi:hypothetical protein